MSNITLRTAQTTSTTNFRGINNFLKYNTIFEVIDYETGEIIDLKPEYTTMSRKPGIAGDWFDKYHPDVYPSDSIHVDGREMRPPKFYDKKMKALDPALMEDILADRLDRFDPLNNTPERLAVRYEVTKARLASYSRDVVNVNRIRRVNIRVILVKPITGYPRFTRHSSILRFQVNNFTSFVIDNFIMGFLSLTINLFHYIASHICCRLKSKVSN
jgi:hypothetical protein